MPETFEATVAEVGDTFVLHLTGDVDRSAGPAVEDAYQRVAGGRRLVLDFTAADYINSSGIALIVSVLARARAEGIAVAAYGLTDHYREIFEITRLSDFIDIYPDFAAAVGQPA